MKSLAELTESLSDAVVKHLLATPDHKRLSDPIWIDILPKFDQVFLTQQDASDHLMYILQSECRNRGLYDTSVLG